MLIVQPDPSVPISTVNNGGICILGAGSQTSTGASVLHFVDDGDLGKTAFVGSLQILGCSTAYDALAFGSLTSPNPLLQQIPFRQIVINGTPLDYSFTSSASTTISTSSIIQIPNSGLWTAVLVTCTAGSGTLYNINVVGAAAP